MKYRVSIQLDELLKQNKISQYSLLKKTNLSHNFINKLVKHKEIANLDKLATIINALNDEGCNIQPSDLIKFIPVDETTIQILASQRFGNSFYFFFKLTYQERPFFDLAKLTIEEKDNKCLLRLTSNDTPLYEFNQEMQKAISAQSFYLSEGVTALAQLPSSEKRIAAQVFAEATITQALKNKVIRNKATYTVYFSYFSDFAITFNHVEQQNNRAHVIKDKNDSLIPRYPEAYQKSLYPFMHAFSTGKVEKGEHFTKPKPHKLSDNDKYILNTLFSTPKN